MQYLQLNNHLLMKIQKLIQSCIILQKNNHYKFLLDIRKPVSINSSNILQQWSFNGRDTTVTVIPRNAEVCGFFWFVGAFFVCLVGFFTTKEISFYLKHSSKIKHRIYFHSYKTCRLTPPAAARTPVRRDHHIQERVENPVQRLLERRSTHSSQHSPAKQAQLPRQSSYVLNSQVPSPLGACCLAGTKTAHSFTLKYWQQSHANEYITDMLLEKCLWQITPKPALSPESLLK